MLPMRDGQTNDERTREDRATQPMDAGWLSFAIWLKGTLSCGSDSSWCCLQTMRCRSGNHYIPHRRPASPQTGGRGCGWTLVEANQGWSRRRREGTIPHLRGGARCPIRPPPLALIKVDIINIAITHKFLKGLTHSAMCQNCLYLFS